jgi:hypothetical protein
MTVAPENTTTTPENLLSLFCGVLLSTSLMHTTTTTAKIEFETYFCILCRFFIFYFF